ncbi:hypothetical protein [Streptomyces tailanensis]|uniref:hypothetical protein n=1 Tax=Streptomyces tailanensis TaxID=2569858 RepID=UPI001FE6A8EF|nr:hypothetical protein [Streptomyces tailanensis]
MIDVHAACRYYSVAELEQLGSRDEAEFEAYGLGPGEIAELRQWALDWESDLRLRLAEEYADREEGNDW